MATTHRRCQIPVQNSLTFMVVEWEVGQLMKKVNLGKVEGPDGMAGCVLKECVDQLAGVFNRVLNKSLTMATVPSCLKSSTVVLLPKRSITESLNYFCSVALTPVIMKLRNWCRVISLPAYQPTWTLLNLLTEQRDRQRTPWPQLEQ